MILAREDNVDHLFGQRAARSVQLGTVARMASRDEVISAPDRWADLWFPVLVGVASLVDLSGRTVLRAWPDKPAPLSAALLPGDVATGADDDRDDLAAHRWREVAERDAERASRRARALAVGQAAGFAALLALLAVGGIGLLLRVAGWPLPMFLAVLGPSTAWLLTRRSCWPGWRVLTRYAVGWIATAAILAAGASAFDAGYIPWQLAALGAAGLIVAVATLFPVRHSAANRTR